MDQQIEVRKIINDEIARIRSSNPSFSLRALARKLNVQPSALSEILNGKRLVTKKMAQKIFERLCVDPLTSSKVLGGLSNRAGSALKSSGYNKFLQINMDQYHLISDWYSFAILALAETEGFRDSPAWVAKRLKIKIPEAAKALQRLERLDLMTRDKTGHLVTTGEQLATSTDTANLYLRKSHHQNLELARQSLDLDPVERRDFSSMTMAIDPQKLPQAKAMVQDFRRKLCAFLESGKKKEVYKICIQLFPLSDKGDLK